MTFEPLTRAEFESIPEAMRIKRTADWSRIVAELGRAHYARYHAATDAALACWAVQERAA